MIESFFRHLNHRSDENPLGHNEWLVPRDFTIWEILDEYQMVADKINQFNLKFDLDPETFGQEEYAQFEAIVKQLVLPPNQVVPAEVAEVVVNSPGFTIDMVKAYQMLVQGYDHSPRPFSLEIPRPLLCLLKATFLSLLQPYQGGDRGKYVTDLIRAYCHQADFAQRGVVVQGLPPDHSDGRQALALAWRNLVIQQEYFQMAVNLKNWRK